MKNRNDSLPPPYNKNIFTIVDVNEDLPNYENYIKNTNTQNSNQNKNHNKNDCKNRSISMLKALCLFLTIIAVFGSMFLIVWAIFSVKEPISQSLNTTNTFNFSNLSAPSKQLNT